MTSVSVVCSFVPPALCLQRYLNPNLLACIVWGCCVTPSHCGLQACAASEDWEAAQEVLQELASPSAPPNIQLTAARMAELIGREQVVHEMDKAR